MNANEDSYNKSFDWGLRTTITCLALKSGLIVSYEFYPTIKMMWTKRCSMTLWADIPLLPILSSILDKLLICFHLNWMLKNIDFCMKTSVLDSNKTKLIWARNIYIDIKSESKSVSSLSLPHWNTCLKHFQIKNLLNFINKIRSEISVLINKRVLNQYLTLLLSYQSWH